MKIAIDESGDTGRKFWKGSSRWFVLSAVIVPDTMNGCGLTCQAVSTYQEEFMYGQELHFGKNTHDQHEDFFQFMADKEYVFASVVMDKVAVLRSRPYIFKSKQHLLKACLDELFLELKPLLDHPTVLLDTNGSRAINRALERFLLNNYGSKHKGDFHSIKDVRYVDSRDEPLVQLADYIAGATRHHVDKHYNSRSFEKYLTHKGKIIYFGDSYRNKTHLEKQYVANGETGY